MTQIVPFTDLTITPQTIAACLATSDSTNALKTLFKTWETEVGAAQDVIDNGTRSLVEKLKRPYDLLLRLTGKISTSNDQHLLIVSALATHLREREIDIPNNPALKCVKAFAVGFRLSKDALKGKDEKQQKVIRARINKDCSAYAAALETLCNASIPLDRFEAEIEERGGLTMLSRFGSEAKRSSTRYAEFLDKCKSEDAVKLDFELPEDYAQTFAANDEEGQFFLAICQYETATGRGLIKKFVPRSSQTAMNACLSAAYK